MDGIFDSAQGVGYANIDSFIGFVVSEKAATLKQLQTEYTTEDLYLIVESLSIPKINEYLATKRAKEMAEMRATNNRMYQRGVGLC